MGGNESGGVKSEELCTSAALWDTQVGRIPIVRLPIDSLFASDSPRLDGECEEHVDTLAQLDSVLPPIVVHRSTMRVIDGMHRLKAAARRGAREIDAQLFDGDEEDAFLLAVDQNSRHGLRLTRAERNAAATRIILSHPQWSDRMIAASAGLSPKTVGVIRRRSGEAIPQLNARVGRDGRSRQVDSTHGRRIAGQLVNDNPRATLREIAKGAGVSLATARDVRARIRRGESPFLPKRQDREPQTTTAVEPAGGLGTPPSVTETLLILKRDPAVRLTDQGRMLLRLLDSNALTAERWRELIENVPMHWVPALAMNFWECSEAWRQAAQQLEERARSVVDQESVNEMSAAGSSRLSRNLRAI